MALSVMLSSCIFEYETPGDEPSNPGGNVDGQPLTLSFKVKSLANQGRAANHNEMVSYLRIIILNEGKLESNRLIQLDNVTLSSDLEYEYRFETTAGQKSFYIIGNEQSVGNISFSVPVTELPAGLQKYISDNSAGGLTLSELLVYYMRDAEGNFPDAANPADADEFARVMNSVYFNPDYAPAADGNYYLPYTAFYGGEQFNITHDTVLDNMYLVPAATKFTFKFNNYREENVVVNGIKISDFNSDVTFDQIDDSFVTSDGTINLGAICDSSYLFGQIDEEETWKSFDGLKFYWIDWMQRVAQMTQTDLSNNVGINQKYGWIEKYTIPDYQTLDNVNNVVAHFYPGTEQWIVYGTVLNGGDPGSIQLGPYYLPESRHIVEFTNEYYDETTNQVITRTEKRQAYYLSLDMNQENTNIKPDFTVVEIDNLQSLFRGTSVIITVNMRKGSYGVYAEIAPWTNNRSYGYVTEHPDEE